MDDIGLTATDNFDFVKGIFKDQFNDVIEQSDSPIELKEGAAQAEKDDDVEKLEFESQGGNEHPEETHVKKGIPQQTEEERLQIKWGSPIPGCASSCYRYYNHVLVHGHGCKADWRAYDVRTGDKKRFKRDDGIFDFEMIEKLEETAVAVMHAIQSKDCARVTSIEFGPCGSDLELPPSADEAGSCVALSVQDAHGHASKPKPISREAGDVSPMELHYPQGVHAVGHQEWRKMPFPMLVDSGAADTMLPSAWFNDY